jgi:hypothetical protein
MEEVSAVRFSKDAALAAVAFSLKDTSGQIMLYRMFDKTGQYLLGEKKVRSAIKTWTVPECKRLGKVIDLFIFKQLVNDESQYNMYLLLERGILYYPNIEKSVSSPQIKMDLDQSQTQTLKANCGDFNY